VFHAFAPGTAEIQAVYQQFVVSAATVTFTTSPPFEPLVIAPNRGPSYVGQTVNARALLQSPNAPAQDVTATATWMLSNPRVATMSVGAQATITAVAPGTTDIQVEFNGLSYSFRFSVWPL
jgi:hypothetical protein